LSTSALLHTSDLTLNAGDKLLCENLDWKIKSGERWAILGLNGAGKTSLLHTLAGLRTATQGEVRLKGKPLTQWSRREAAQRIGLLLQEHDEPLSGHVLDYVLIGRHPHLRHWQWESDADLVLARQALMQVDLSGYAQRDIATLSGGERQRMAIAAVLAQQPQLYLLDEPVNHLDWHHQHELLRLFSNLAVAKGKTIVMAVHDVNLAVRYCDHVLLMYEQGKTKLGTVEELLTPANLTELYGHAVEQIQTDSLVLFAPV